jgi:hypothetical protein
MAFTILGGFKIDTGEGTSSYTFDNNDIVRFAVSPIPRGRKTESGLVSGGTAAGNYWDATPINISGTLFDNLGVTGEVALKNIRDRQRDIIRTSSGKLVRVTSFDEGFYWATLVSVGQIVFEAAMFHADWLMEYSCPDSQYHELTRQTITFAGVSGSTTLTTPSVGGTADVKPYWHLETTGTPGLQEVQNLNNFSKFSFYSDAAGHWYYVTSAFQMPVAAKYAPYTGQLFWSATASDEPADWTDKTQLLRASSFTLTPGVNSFQTIIPNTTGIELKYYDSHDCI